MSDLQPIDPEAAVDLYLEERAGEVADETLKSHEYRLAEFVNWCEENEFTNMNEIDGRDLHAFRVARREDGLKPVSLRGQLSTLREFLRFCVSIEAVLDGLPEKVLLPTVSGREQASETKLDPERADDILDYLSQYHYASRDHVVIALLWRTGMRTGSLRGLDLRDYLPDEQALRLRHRPPETPLKNQDRGERMIALDERLVSLLDSYIDGPRFDVIDDEGRNPLVTTRQGRPVSSTIRSIVYDWTRPCMIGKSCPHDRDPDDCEATDIHKASRCPSARSPHDCRSGAITAHLLDNVPVEIVSDRCNVTRKVLSRHYDRRSERERMEQRRKHL